MVFFLEVATSGPFYKRNAITTVDLPWGTVPGLRAQNNGKTCF